MVKKLTWEEKFIRFKEEMARHDMMSFFHRYNQMKEIEAGLLKEKKEQFGSEKTERANI